AGQLRDADAEPLGGAPDIAPGLGRDKTTEVSFMVNGRRQDVRLQNRTSLLDVPREHLDLPGTKNGCDAGACGAAPCWSTIAAPTRA
ncbi:MAG: hypothetical protein ACXW2Y_09075, partial [Acidimicrobiia bacterium]